MEEETRQGPTSHIRCRAIIEVLGKPKEHVENSIKQYIEHIKDDSELVMLSENYSEIQEQGKLWSKFVEIELVVKGTSKLIGFCFEYMPSSVEIIKPSSFLLTNSEFANFINDLQSRLHNVDMVVKKLKSENDFLRLSMNDLAHNAVMICLKVSKMSIDKLSQVTGIEKEELQIYVEKMMKDNKIKKEGDLYLLG